MEEEKETKEPENIKKGTEKKLRIGSVIVLVLVIGVLVIAKIRDPELPTFWIVMAGGFVLLLVVLGVFWNKISQAFSKGEKESDADKVPEPISREEIQNLVHNFVTQTDIFESHIKEFVTVVPHSYGKNQIYEIQCRLAHEDEDRKGILHIFVNSNYPSAFPAYGWNMKPAMAKGFANAVSHNPEESPDEEITERRSPLTGVEEKITKRTRRRKKTKEKEEET